MCTSQSVRCVSTPSFMYRAQNGRTSEVKTPGHDSAFTSHTMDIVRNAVIPIALKGVGSSWFSLAALIERVNVLRGGHAMGNGVTPSFQHSRRGTGCWLFRPTTLRPPLAGEGESSFDVFVLVIRRAKVVVVSQYHPQRVT